MCVMIAFDVGESGGATWWEARVDAIPVETLVGVAPFEVCGPSFYTTHTVDVRGCNDDGCGEFSDPLLLVWHWNFNASRSGTVGYPDFTRFSNEFGQPVPASGVLVLPAP